MAYSLPDDKGRYSQPNNGNSRGNIYMTYGIDLHDNVGRLSVSTQVKKLINDADDAQFAGYAGSIGAYSTDGVTGKIFAVSDEVFSANFTDQLGAWTEETAGSAPSSGNTIMDSAFFDGLFLVSEAYDIKSWNGSTWASWWKTTLGQASLEAGERHLIWTGKDGNLYIVDNGNKVYRVTPTGTVTKTGNGTLDFSATQYEITCAVPNSSRSFIGTVDLTGEEAVILEWDMSPSASTANRLHPTGAKSVRCIAVWNDTPIALLSNGKVKYFDGTSFVEFKESVQFPVTDGYELDDQFVHPNGWAIIDDMPHFLITGRVESTSTLTGTKNASYQMPAGVWALDPSIGLYHRFALGAGLSTPEDYGKMQIVQVGALYSLQKNESKFLASYEYRLDTEAANRSVLVYHDAAGTAAGRGYLMTPYIYSLRETLKKSELFHKELVTGEKIKVYYRNKTEDVLAQSGTWATTSTFHIVGTSLGIEKGDIAFIKMGPGSGQLLKVSDVSESSTVTVITFSEANTFASVNDLGVADFTNFRFMGEITSTTADYHQFSIPEQGKKRKTQFLFEFQQAANNTMELDFAIIT